jgi:hypothetical protein
MHEASALKTGRPDRVDGIFAQRELIYLLCATGRDCGENGRSVTIHH